jgi:hypothetical protein
MERKPVYSPPGWLVTHFDKVKLDEERAQKLEGMRQRLCDATDSPDDHTNFPFISSNALWMKALDLLLEREAELLEEVKKVKESK